MHDMHFLVVTLCRNLCDMMSTTIEQYKALGENVFRNVSKWKNVTWSGEAASLKLDVGVDMVCQKKIIII